MSKILQAPRNFWCDKPVTRAGLLVDGDDYYRAFYAAAQQAEHHILLAGWQFDTDACILRGEEARRATLPVTLLEFLDALCERNQRLRVCILAWDFHAVFALEREWMQELRFNWSTNDRLQFLFDDKCADQGSHHQKFVVIDDRLSFLGGLDLCDHRWDDRKHTDPNPLRISRGEPHKPFHDLQAYLTGPEVARELTALFAMRWEAAGGDPIAVYPPIAMSPPSRSAAFDLPEGAVELAASRVALSRTDLRGRPTGAEGCREICDLHLDAIAQAERVIYIETQYFSSKEIGAALAARLAAADTATLEVVLVLNMQAETFKEEIAVGLAQAKVLSDLRLAVAGTPHRLGIYYTVPCTPDGAEPERSTYIHSKIMIVDDRFLTVGSANLTNRSTCVDTELNASFETDDPSDALGASITRARQSLIAEHLGVPGAEARDVSGLVEALNGFAERREGRLRIHPSPTERENEVLKFIDPQQLPFDPDAMEEQDRDRSIFVGGLGALWRRLSESA